MKIRVWFAELLIKRRYGLPTSMGKTRAQKSSSERSFDLSLHQVTGRCFATSGRSKEARSFVAWDVAAFIMNYDITAYGENVDTQ